MSTPETSIQPAAIQQKIGAGQLDDALADINTLLAANADNADALYMAAVCHRYKQQYESAQDCLDRLKYLSSDKGRVYQEQGYLYRARNQLQQAVAAFSNACQLNPALEASWQAQHDIWAGIGRTAEAQQAHAQVQRLRQLPRPLVAVTDLVAQGKLLKAEALCRKFLKQVPTHVEGMRLLADIATRFGVLEDAEFLLESAVEFAPQNTQLKIDYVAVLRKRQKFEQALDQAQRLYRDNPNNPQLQSIYAIEKMHTADYAGAIALFDQVLQTLPNDAVTLTSKGHALKTWGKQAEAVDSYRAALKHAPRHGEAFYSLSNLKTYRFSDSEIEAMLQLQGSPELDPANSVYCYFALGKAFEDKGEYATSFGYYQKGNSLKRQQSNYDADKMSSELAAQRAFFSPAVLSSAGSAGCDAPDPIFIVGLPRAGSTLLEQILSSHSLVDGTLELPNILSMAQKLRRQGQGEGNTPYPDLLAELSSTELRALGQQYIDETRIHRQGAPFFIDKMPNNFRHIGLIKLILPGAKIIDARRHPMACCFSGFKQLFAEGQEFSYSLGDIAQYYNDYARLMDHWDEAMPGAVLRVHYERVVSDFENQVRRILDYCGLPFEEGCLSFYETKRAVRTASSEQVRQPIYQSGVDQWVHYEDPLQDLKTALKSSLAAYPDI